VRLAATLLVASGCFVDAIGEGGPAGAGGATSSSDASAAVGPSSGASTSAGASAGGEGGVGQGGEAGAGGEGGAPVAVACGAQYVGLVLCAEDVTSCSVIGPTAFVLGCDVICAGAGGECQAAFDNSGCTIGRRVACDFTGYADTLCVCSRGCGGGPPCVLPAACTSGVCI
jgi:hypothetical protein